MLRCVIVDDEVGAQMVLEQYLSRIPETVLAGKFFNAIEALHYLRQHPADVLLLDINLPEINGFGLLDLLTNRPAVVFITAYTDHALKGFDYDAVDYLHKPVRFERFVQALNKARKWAEQIRSVQLPEAKTITLRIDGYDCAVATTSIRYAESLRNYLKIHTEESSFLVLMPMQDLERQLGAPRFMRIHKSYLVNTERVTRVGLVELTIGKVTLPIGKTYRKYVKEALASTQ
jgi:DNA-binding LytR/AlgR family response regulator